jgi:hypothetical protein
MKYTKEITDRLVLQYRQGATPEDLSRELGVPVRSIIAKLSSLGVYQRKQYLNKRGEVPIKKSELILELSKHLDLPLELLESLEKVNKIVLESIIRALTDPKPE